MRAVCLLLLITVAASGLTAATPQHAEPRCAFADPSFTTLVVVANSIAEFYVRHRRWPLSKEQLRDEALQSAHTLPAAQRPSARDIDRLFGRFGTIEFQPRGRDLILAVDYRAEGKRQQQRILFHPGRSADQILEESAPAK
jgi:hypothetical protein